MMEKIFIIEDDENISEILKFNLQAEGFDVQTEKDGERGLSALLSGDAQLLVLDLMLPSLSGFEILKKLRESSDIPVIVLSALDSEEDKLEALSLMADDYVTKPFSVKELIARIKVNLARSRRSPREAAVFSCGPLTVNADKMAVLKNGAELSVSKKEYEILLLLLKSRGRVVSREEILEKVWGYNGYLGDLHTVDVAIGRLRAKVEDIPSEPKIILSRRGAGYIVI